MYLADIDCVAVVIGAVHFGHKCKSQQSFVCALGRISAKKPKNKPDTRAARDVVEYAEPLGKRKHIHIVIFVSPYIQNYPEI